VTAITKSTTSKSDGTDRFLAAQQLFTAIIGAQGGMLAIKSVIANSPPAYYGGKYVPTFTVTYGDGGKEQRMVAPGVSPSLVIDGNIGPLPAGDGVLQSCPASA